MTEHEEMGPWTAKSAPPDRSPEGIARDIGKLVHGFLRAAAGYNKFASIYDQAVNGVPEGVCKVHAPILRYVAAITSEEHPGGNAVECSIDPNEVPHDYKHVLPGLICHMHGEEMIQCSEAMEALAKQLNAIVCRDLKGIQPLNMPPAERCSDAGIGEYDEVDEPENDRKPSKRQAQRKASV